MERIIKRRAQERSLQYSNEVRESFRKLFGLNFSGRIDHKDDHLILTGDDWKHHIVYLIVPRVFQTTKGAYIYSIEALYGAVYE